MKAIPQAGLLIGIALQGLAAQAQVTEEVSFDVPLPDVFYDVEIFSSNPSGGAGRESPPLTGVPRFDPALGTLTQMLVSLEFDWEYSLDIDANGIINGGIPHDAYAEISQVAFGLFFVDLNGLQRFVGNTVEDAAVGCFGEPFEGDACSDFSGDSGTRFPFAVNLLPTLNIADVLIDPSDPVGTANIDFLEYGINLSGAFFDLTNVASATVYGFFEIFGGTTMTVTYVYETDNAPDEDGDGVADSSDNCTQIANPDQTDSNGDGYGNACDGDVNDDCNINATDLGALRAGFFSSNPDIDFNSDGVVNASDLGILRTMFFGTPGPSGVTSTCDP